MRVIKDRRWKPVAAATLCSTFGAWGCSALLGYDDLEFSEADAATFGTARSSSGSSRDDGGDTGGAGGGAGASSSASGAPSSSSGATTTSSGGPDDPCAGIACNDHAHCVPNTGTCLCDPGFVSNADACVIAPAGDPTTHTEAEVCARWSEGHVTTDPSPWTAGLTECAPGTLSRAGINDTLTRLAMFRWMVGLDPVSDDDGLNALGMSCAAVTSWNPPGVVPAPHAPPPDATCYTPEGASGAGQSNIAWGSGHPAEAIDQFIRDFGSESTMGHRRWIFNPPLGPVGIGYYAGGGPYGNSQCLAVFGASGGGAAPSWLAFPPPGYAPVQLYSWMWTFHRAAGVGNASMTVTRSSDGAVLPMAKQELVGGYGQPAVGFTMQGWTATSGETYVVEVSGVGAAPITYELRPVGCN